MDVQTGAAAQVAGTAWTDAMFGYRYTGFRGLGRFDDQLADNHVGMIGWPGGFLAEDQTDRYGLGFDGLFNPEENRPGLAEMFAYARSEGAGLAVVLPTARYLGQDELLRTDIRAFMGDLLSGHYGQPPATLVFEIGSEFYASFPGGPTEAADYGHIARIYVEEMAAALNDPAVNISGLDPAIAVQAGRTLAEDGDVRARFDADTLAEVDQIVHHRFPYLANGVDRSADEFHAVLDAWRADVAEAGGEGPDLFLSAYNVGSLTREEALQAFLDADHDAGGDLTADRIDLAARTNDGFEQFWQDQLTLRDYGSEQPRLLLEMLNEYKDEGLTAAQVFGTDMIHPGRLSLTDVNGVAQDFVGQTMLDMMAESVVGTRSLAINLQNGRGDEVWTYGFENDDRLVIFLSADETPPDTVTLRLAGLGDTYRQVAVDSLRAEVPQDWMARFGIVDNSAVDETPEAQTFAVGVRSGLDPVIGGDGVTVQFSAPGEVIRLSFAKTDAGAGQIAGYSDGQLHEIMSVEGGLPAHPAIDPADFSDLPMIQMDDADPDAMAQPEALDADGGDAGGGGGGFALALLPFLFLLGGF